MKAYELLDRPEKWNQFCSARNKDELPVRAIAEDAVCWCASGAILKCYEDVVEYHNAINKVRDYFDDRYDTLILWNDALHRTYEEVHSLLKELDV